MEPPRAPPAPLTLHWFGHTDRGKVRPHNEDAFLGLRFDAREVHRLGKLGHGSTRDADYAFAVCDGLGGARAGEYASRVAVEQITTLLPRAFKQSAKGLEAGFEDVLGELFDQIHHALAHLGQSYEECAGMETTLTLCWFTPAWMYFGHIGDSRLYYLPARGGALKQLSHDDTHVGWLFHQGKLNEREARNHPRRSVLQKALGGGHQFVEPQAGAVGYEPGDTFLLCTDGLVDGLYDHHLVELLRPVAAGSAVSSTGPETSPPGGGAVPARDGGERLVQGGVAKTPPGGGAAPSGVPATPPGGPEESWDAEAGNPAQLLVREAVEKSGRDNTTALVIRLAADSPP